MSYTDTYTQTPAEMLAAEFVTSYPMRGVGRVHAADCISALRRRGAAREFPTAAPAVKMGRAWIAKCCTDHEGRMINLIGRIR